MKYYFIRHSTDLGEIGTFSQIQKAHYKPINKGEQRISELFFTKSYKKVVTPVGVVHGKAKLTDLMSATGQGFTLGLLISDRLKEILEKYEPKYIEFFEASVLKRRKEFKNYWLVNGYNASLYCVDFNKTVFEYKEFTNNVSNKVEVFCEDFQEFDKIHSKHLAEKNILGAIKIKRLFVRTGFNDHFFMLRHVEGGLGFLVSEQVKKDIERFGCTGIRFQPTEISFSEWNQQQIATN